jgi:hypothetical protein
MKKNPILVFTGLAVAAVAAVMGLTRDRWMPPQPQVAETADVSQPAAQTGDTQADTAPAPAPDAEQAAAPETAAPAEPAAESAEAPAQEQQATAPAGEQQPAASSEQQQALVPAEAPAATAETAAAPEAEAATPPTFDTVRVEKTGEAVIAGRAEAGSDVEIKLDGKTIGTAVANAEGSFVVVPDQPLPAGTGALTIESTGQGETAPTQSEQTVAVIVPEQSKENTVVALVSPSEPTKVLQRPEPEPETAEAPAAPDAAAQPDAAPEAAAEPEVSPATETAAAQPDEPAQVEKTSRPPRRVILDAVDYDSAGNIVFSGQGEPGTGARIYIDNGFVGEAPVAEDGRWVFSATTDVAPGVHSLRIDGLDGTGKVVNRIEVPFFREESRKVAAAAAPESGQTGEKGDAPEDTAGTAGAVAEAPVAEAPAAEEPAEGRVIIQPGNNLWRISKVIYGEGLKYTVLYQANKDQIRNPDLIYPGQVFRTPDVVPPETIDPAARDPLAPAEGTATAQ